MKKLGDYKKYDKIIKARRIIVNVHSNYWNNEPEYKLQKVRIYGESKTGKSYIVDSYGNFKFICHKSRIFLNKDDFNEKKDNILGFNLLENEKKYLESLF